MIPQPSSRLQVQAVDWQGHRVSPNPDGPTQACTCVHQTSFVLGLPDTVGPPKIPLAHVSGGGPIATNLAKGMPSWLHASPW